MIARITLVGLVLLGSSIQGTSVEAARKVKPPRPVQCMPLEIKIGNVCWPDQQCPPMEHQVGLICVPD